MWHIKIQKFLRLVFMMATAGYAASGSAHGIDNVTMDAAGVSRTFTGLAFVTCSNDGSGEAENLIARIRDKSAPADGLLVNLQLYKGNKAVSITDTVSGDSEYSPYVTLHGGPGIYWMIVNKTDAGTRVFDIEWHCNTASGVHTGTDIGVAQFE